MNNLLTSPRADEPITVNIVRTVHAGKQEAFEALLRAFIPQALAFPGHLGVHVVKPAARTSRDYHVVLKFNRREQWQSFQMWPEYQQFRADIEPLLEREPCVEELSGLESWITMPHTESLRPLPRWKMALVTLLGVYPTSLSINLLLRPWLAHWSVWLQVLVFSSCMVGLLTWIVMPQLTQLLAPWLYPSDKEKRRNPKASN